jgi:hypothetical protein
MAWTFKGYWVSTCAEGSFLISNSPDRIIGDLGKNVKDREKSVDREDDRI